MKLRGHDRVLWTALILVLAAVLVVLAVLQYRWSGAVSEAASERLRANLQASVNGFRQELYRDFAGICLALQTESPDAPPATPAQYAERVQSWKRTAVHPALISTVYYWQGVGSDREQLLSLDSATGQFEPGTWPGNLGKLAERMKGASGELAALAGRFRREATEHPGPGGAPPAGQRRGPMPPWFVEQNIPALVYPLFHRGAQDDARIGVDWLIVQLDDQVIREHILPELASRYFSGSDGLDYQVAVVGGGGRFIYSSDGKFGASPALADATEDLFQAPPRSPGRGAGLFLFGARRPDEAGGRERGERFAPIGGLPRLEPIHYTLQDGDWQLLVKHRKGSLDSVVAQLRWRNLAVSFGVLLVLAVTMALFVVVTQRAHRLARLQMEFVAGVSHELRTPLAVIASAADNIADGIVDGRAQLTRYGTVIKAQARQLSRLVEQILLFAAARESRYRYHLRPLRVAEIIDAAIADTADVTRAAGVTIQKQVEEGLPPVMGDLSALSHGVQNLITNAVKYGGEDRWIGIRAQGSAATDSVREIQITVEDHGQGIAAADLERIFEPFYRSASAAAAQIHGTGLGLSLAKSIVEAMGGALEVRSTPGQGSAFTLWLPAADAAGSEAAEDTAAPAGSREGS
jgi:signal transduction histidine kinase